MTTTHRGLFAIPPTPFKADGTFDEDSLRRTISFCLEAGTHGIVTPVNASEFSTLSADERHVVARATVEEIARSGKKGHVPAVIGVCAPTTAEAVGYARHAADIGADHPHLLDRNLQDVLAENVAQPVAALAAERQQIGRAHV